MVFAALDLVEYLFQLGLATHKIPGHIPQLVRQRICNEKKKKG